MTSTPPENKAEPKAACAPIRALLLLPADALSPEEIAQRDAHLPGCEDCQRLAERSARSQVTLNGLFSAPPPEQVTTRLDRRMEKLLEAVADGRPVQTSDAIRSAGRSWRDWLTSPWGMIPVMAALALVVALPLLRTPPSSSLELELLNSAQVRGAAGHGELPQYLVGDGLRLRVRLPGSETGAQTANPHRAYLYQWTATEGLSPVSLNGQAAIPVPAPGTAEAGTLVLPAEGTDPLVIGGTGGLEALVLLLCPAPLSSTRLEALSTGAPLPQQNGRLSAEAQQVLETRSGCQVAIAAYNVLTAR